MSEDFNKIEISKDGYLILMNKIYKNKLEERELALDRYRRADALMDGDQQFVFMGKNAVAFLMLASNCTNELSKLAHEIKTIVYKDEMSSNNGGVFDDKWRKDTANNIMQQGDDDE